MALQPPNSMPLVWQCKICPTANIPRLDSGGPGAGEPIIQSPAQGFIPEGTDSGSDGYGLWSRCDEAGDLWLDSDTLDALKSSAIWLGSDGLIKPFQSIPFPGFTSVNQFVEELGSRLQSLSSVVAERHLDAKSFDNVADGEWTYRLEDTISVVFPQAASGVLASFDSVYQAGELVYTSGIEYLTWFLDQFRLLAREFSDIVSRIATWFKSRKGLCDTIGIFMSERSWYLHHSAHPPEATVRAVGGRFAAATRRVCFRPLPP